MKPKELILDINGQNYKVTISRFTADEAEISVDGKTYTVGLKDLGIEQIADIKPQPAPFATQPIMPAPGPAAQDGKKPAAPIPVHRPKTLANSNAITAPLPGMILKILVQEGQTIQPGQPVMTLEAMKMENEVTASTSGVIIDIRFKEGASVNQGETLILLKPVEA